MFVNNCGSASNPYLSPSILSSLDTRASVRQPSNVPMLSHSTFFCSALIRSPLSLQRLFAPTSQHRCNTDILCSGVFTWVRTITSAIQRFQALTLQSYLCYCVSAPCDPAKTRSHPFALVHCHDSVTVALKLKRSCTSKFQLSWDFIFLPPCNLATPGFCDGGLQSFHGPRPQRSCTLAWSSCRALELINSHAHALSWCHRTSLLCNQPSTHPSTLPRSDVSTLWRSSFSTISHSSNPKIPEILCLHAFASRARKLSPAKLCSLIFQQAWTTLRIQSFALSRCGAAAHPSFRFFNLPHSRLCAPASRASAFPKLLQFHLVCFYGPKSPHTPCSPQVACHASAMSGALPALRKLHTSQTRTICTPRIRVLSYLLLPRSLHVTPRVFPHSAQFL